MKISHNCGAYQFKDDKLKELSVYKNSILDKIKIKEMSFDRDESDGIAHILGVSFGFKGLNFYLSIHHDIINKIFGYGLVSGEVNYIDFNENVLNTERDIKVLIANQIYIDTIKGLIKEVPDGFKEYFNSNDDVSILIALIAVSVYADYMY